MKLFLFMLFYCFFIGQTSIISEGMMPPPPPILPQDLLSQYVWCTLDAPADNYKYTNLINESIKEILRAALKYKFTNRRKNSHDHTFKEVSCDIARKFYEEAICADTACIYLLYGKSEQKFAEKVIEKIIKIAKTPTGAQLLIDIIVENKRKQNPVIILSCTAATDIAQTSIKLNEKRTFSIQNPPNETAFRDDNHPDHGNVIFVKMDQTLNYSYFKYDANLTGNTFPIGKKTTKVENELDVTLFHELNHYRHYLQKVFDLSQRLHDAKIKDICTKIQIDCMLTNEEELQLIGYCKPSRAVMGYKRNDIYDIISETLYRYDSQQVIRFPYSQVQGGSVQKKFIDEILANRKHVD